MIRHIFVAVILALAAKTALAEDLQYKNPRAVITPDSFDDVSVRISDDARNGCWTNLREVKTYSEDKLALRGFNVVEHDDTTRLLTPDQAVMNVRVISSRSRNGSCFGVITVDLMSTLTWKNYLSLKGSIGAGSDRIFTGADNANVLILETAEHFIKEWPAGIE